MNSKSSSGVVPHPPLVPPFTAQPGLRVDMDRDAKPEDYFSLFLTDDIWKYMVEETNKYAHHKLQRQQPPKRSLYQNWRDVSLEEMRAFVAITLNMGITQLPTIKDYWSKHEVTNLPYF